MIRRVIKVGGSLLCDPQLVDRLTRFVTESPPTDDWIVFGGGDMINAIRKLDQIRPLPAAEVHWWCVEMLATSFEIASCWFPTWERVATPSDFERARSRKERIGGCRLVNVPSFYHRADSPLALPEDWRTTTDAIAAFLAERVHAEQCVLLKSCEVPNGDLQQLAIAGIVDDALPQFTATHDRNVRVQSLPQ